MLLSDRMWLCRPGQRMTLSLLWGIGALIKLDFEAVGVPASGSGFGVLELSEWPEVVPLLLETEVGRCSLSRVYEALVRGACWLDSIHSS